MNNTGKIYQSIVSKMNANKKMFAVLIDPDKQNFAQLLKTIELSNANNVDYFFVGGSLLTQGDLSNTVRFIKENSKIPVILFPGSHNQISDYADGILYLSLISGRNPEYLIGSQVTSAPLLKKTSLEVISTGYMLVDCSSITTAIYISGTPPIPYHKNDIASCTALAGEYLGLKLIYLDGGSGASQPISESMVKEVANTINSPLIVGGGITSEVAAKNIYNAGANVVVIGNGIEKDNSIIEKICSSRNELNQN